MKVFLTGADGFIGSHLAELLVQEGHEVKALSYYNSFNHRGWLEEIPLQTVQNMEIVAGDIRDPAFVRQHVKGMDAVLHLAALIAIPFSYHAPQTYVETNILGTLNILQSVQDWGVGRMIHTSTSEVYGTAKFIPITEEHPLQGQSPYSASKIGADQIVRSFFCSFGTPATIIRPFNTYGPRQSARAFIPSVISQLASNENGKVRLGSLHPTRDFNFVHDTARGFLKALTAPQIAGETINLASQFEISMKDTALQIAKIIKKDLVLEEDPARIRPAQSEVERLFGDRSKAKKLLGWEPEFGGLDGFQRGLEKTIEWFIDPRNLKHYKPHLYNL